METHGTEHISTTLPLDTLAMMRHLQQHGFSEEQAEGQVELFRQLIENNLATKTDVAKVEAALKLDIAGVEQKIEQLRIELKSDIINAKYELIKWVMPVMLAQVGMIAAVIFKVYGS